MSPMTLKRVHLKESLASHEEAQRLQRMCRELKNKETITRVLKEAQYKSESEAEIAKLYKEDKLIDEDYELLEAPIRACSKFTLSLTGPDFTSHKVEDPFKKLGPIAIFSARRHWTAPRSVRLQKGKGQKIQRSKSPLQCNCKRTSYEGQCEVCSKYIAYSSDDGSVIDAKDDGAESFGFHVRGDAPVIISHVDINSLADVSV